MITTTVTVITTMLNSLLHKTITDPLFVGGVISGIISGIVVTVFVWWIANVILSPRIRISRDIAFEIVPEKRPKKDVNGKIIKDSKGQTIDEDYFATVYRFKIANDSIRSAFDINIYLRIRYKSQYAIIRAPYQPFLNGRRCSFVVWVRKIFGYKESYQNHRLVPFRMTNIRMSKIEGFKDEKELIRKHSNGELSLEDFRQEDTIFEIIVNAVDSISGSALRVLSQVYTQSDLNKHVKEGEFLDGEMFVRTKEKSKTATT